jgi:regulatory protein
MALQKRKDNQPAAGENKIKSAEKAMARFCSYQERTVNQVREKLSLRKIDPVDAERIINKLIGEGFINEERFAVSYMLGKFRQNKWGRNKIRYAMRGMGIDNRLIDKAAGAIDEEEYGFQLRKIIRKKAGESKLDPYVKKNKIANFLIGKGFESDLVWGIIKEEVED